jgi:hypothetical protein
MTVYQEGHVKRDPASGTVAVRTVFPDTQDFAHMQWLTATTGRGAHNRTTPEVEGWEDLFVPEPPPEPAPAERTA